MDVDFKRADYRQLEVDGSFTGGFPSSVVTAFRKRMQAIRSAPDERVFYALKSLHFEKLKGDRSGQYSMRLNDQWRLVIEFRVTRGSKEVMVIAVEDYH
jgi:proteic killer suppression protein